MEWNFYGTLQACSILRLHYGVNRATGALPNDPLPFIKGLRFS